MTSRTLPQSAPHVWCIVPAAGVGSRMQAVVPKPYLRLGGRFLLDITLERLLTVNSVSDVFLALNPNDQWWPQAESATSPRVTTFIGGAERDDSVRAGLDIIRGRAAVHDWVLVHDVARPCVCAVDIERLLAALEGNDVGGLLAAPLVDTIKEASDGGLVERTLDRRRLWRALTPQVFRFGILDRALTQARESGLAITDEASAVEALGLSPLLVAGRPDNIKVTLPDDLAFAAWILHLD